MVHYLKNELYELIKKDERIFDFIQEGSLDGIWYWDLEHPENEWMSPKFWQVLGYNPEKMPHQSSAWQDIINQDDLKRATDNFHKHLKDPENPYDQIVRYKHKNKSTIWIRCRGIAIRDNNNIPTRMLGAHQDITALKVSENNLKKEKNKAIQVQKKYKSMVLNAPLSFQVLDNNGYITDVNPEWLKTTGYNKKQVIGNYFGDFLHPDSIELFKKNLLALKKQGFLENEQYRIKKKDGNFIYVSFEGFLGFNEKGKFTHAYCTIKDITKDREAQNKLKMFNRAIDHSLNAFDIINHEGKFIYVNQAYVEMSGYDSISEIIGTSPVDHCHDPNMPNIVINELKKNGFFIGEFKAKRKDGSLYDINMYARLDYDENGNEIYPTTSIDITEEKEAKIAINESEEKFKGVFNSAKIGIALANSTGHQLDVNKEFLTMLGYSRKEYQSLNFTDISHPDDLEIELPFFNKIQNGEISNYNIEKRLRKKDGNYIWVDASIAVRRDQNGDISMFIVTAKDITQKRKTKQELSVAKKDSEEKERKLKNLLGNLKGVAYQCKNDKNWTMLFISKGVKELTGYEVNDIKNNNVISWNQIIHEDYREHVDKIVSEAIVNNMPFTLEYKITCKKGEEKWVWEKGFMEMSNNKPSHLEGFITDITPLKNYEKELLVAKNRAEDSNRLKTEFLHNMSHEIRTPMNGIMGFSDMLTNQDLTPEKRNYYSRIVQNCSHQLLRTIDDILEISTLETEQVGIDETEFCLNDFLMELFSIFSLKLNERNIPLYIKKELRDNKSYITTDKTKLNKVISNLLENSLKYTLEGFIEFGYYIDKAMLVIYVKDTGIGISPENHQLIFERFSQENKELSKKIGGLGLGLAIAEENTSLLGGHIDLDSDKNKGSTFYINIPYKPANSIKEGDSKENTVANQSEHNYNILIAEDEEVNFLYLEALLEENEINNYTVIHAKNGQEAIDICLNNKNIDLILMDIKMPIMNGHEASKKIKSKIPKLPIIAQTAYSTESEKRLALESGCDAFIAKPIKKEELYTLITQYIIK